MKVAHFCFMQPHRTGMYESIREIVEISNKMKIDAGLIDTDNPDGGHIDRNVITKNISWANDADIYTLSTKIPSEYLLDKKPKIFMIHGTIQDNFLGEEYNCLTPGNSKPYTSTVQYIRHPRIKASVTMWKEYYDYYAHLATEENRVYFVQAGVDCTRFKPAGSNYQFAEKGEPQLMFCDTWRWYKHPYHILIGLKVTRKEYFPDLKFALYGVSESQASGFWNRVLLVNKFNEFVNEYDNYIPDLDVMYRSVDMVVTPMDIPTRIVRESLASGTPVIAGGCEFTPYNFHPLKPRSISEAIKNCYDDIKEYGKEEISKRCREMAVKHLNIINTIRGLHKVYKDIV